MFLYMLTLGYLVSDKNMMEVNPVSQLPAVLEWMEDEDM